MQFSNIDIFFRLNSFLHSIYTYIITHPRLLTISLLLWFVICGFMEWNRNINRKKIFLYYMWKVAVWGVFWGGMIMIWYVTLGNRPSYGEMNYRFTLFWSYREVFFHNNRFILWQIIWNIVAFLPMGHAMYYLLGEKRRIYKVVLWIGTFSTCIELSQLFFQMGLFEFDDILHNTLGAVLGYFVAWIIRKAGDLLINNTRK